MATVEFVPLWKREHRMRRWMDAYGEGLATKDVQAKVKKLSSTKYSLHRRIPESVACFGTLVSLK